MPHVHPLDTFRRTNRPFVTEAARRFRAGDRSPETLVLAHLPIAIAIARKYRYQTEKLDAEDLVGEATLALVEAAATYDPAGAEFPLHAAVTIHRHLWRALREAEPVRVPVGTHRVLHRLRSRLQEAEDRGDQPDMEALAHELGITTKRLAELKALVAALDPPFHLDRSVSDDDELTLGGAIAAPTSVEDEAIEELTREETKQELQRALDGLPEGARVSLGLNLGVPTFEAATVAEVAAYGRPDRQERARRRLRRLFREGEADARRLGYEPGDAEHARKPGQRILGSLSRVGQGPGGGREQRDPANLWRSLVYSLRETEKVGAGRHVGA